MKKLLFLLVSTVICHSLTFAQAENPSTNKWDSQGHKQGVWIKYYKNGNKAYVAKFKNDTPVDTLTRFYDSGETKVMVVFDKAGKSSHASYFHKNGKTAAQGAFIGENKDGIWKYYSEDSVLVMVENYSKGKTNGKTSKYYKTGTLMEEKEFVNGVPTGSWTVYYPAGRQKYIGTFLDGKLNGLMKTFGPNGKPISTGLYKDGLKDGAWTFYNQDGNMTKVVTFINGVATNKDSLDLEQTKQLLDLEKNAGRFEEPTPENTLEQMGY